VRLCLRLRRMRLRLRRWWTLIMSLRQSLRQWFRSPEPPVQAGEARLYHFQRQNGPEKARIHLRVDGDGSGILLVNANRVVHLNPSAVEMARLALEDVSPEQAVKQLSKRYNASKQQLTGDYQALQMQINELVRPDGACPIHELDLEVLAPFSATPAAPYRMDLALTYRCNNDCAHCYNARSRDFGEMDTQQWKAVLNKVWQVGIPHVVFTGGEPTLRPDLPELVAYAESLGMVAGLNTNGRRLQDPRFAAQLVEAGLDHVQITLESHDPAIHDQMVRLNGAWQQTVAGIRQALQTKLYVMTNTTMLQANAPHMAETLDFLAELGVPTIGLNALIYSGRGAEVGTGLDERQLTPLLELARQKTDAAGQRLIWYTPTEYCHFDPMSLELGVKGCTAARYNMCVEPDGAVLPCQSYYEPLGRLLHDEWEAIWNHPLALRLRQRQYLAEKCVDCALLSECGGGCPLKTAA
jgi:radical SAM protein with 4Fe4S-binding SPASM domain